MNDLEKYHDQIIEQRPASFEAVPEAESETTANLLAAVLRRWYIVLLVFIAMCGIGIPTIWLLVEPSYTVTGAIQVAPILRNIITGKTDMGQISNYQIFMQTQADLVKKSNVLQRVADDLADRNLSFFEDEPTDLMTKLKQRLQATKTKPDAVTKLKRALSSGVIRVAPDRRTELMKISMKSRKPDEAKLIVDAFINAYMAVEVSESAKDRDQNLRLLEDEQKARAEKLKDWNQKIRDLGQEFGTTDLVSRQDMRLRRVMTLLSELTKIEARRINLEARLQFLEQAKEQTIAPEELLTMRSQYVNSDPMVQELTRSIVQLERDLLVAKQTLKPANPALQQKQELLNAFQSRVEEKRQEIGNRFDETANDQIKKAHMESMLNAQTELEQAKVHEKYLNDVLAKEDTQVIEIGRTHLDIQNLEFQRELDQQYYDQVCRRIEDVKLEGKAPARVTVAYHGDVGALQDKRIKYTTALMFGAVACGMILALLRDKADLSVRTPEDVAKRIGIRILGTTASTHIVKPSLLPAQIIGDYQTIRANLGLLNHGGMPKKLVVTSPAMREGKTTFSINLATSISKSGKKVLLIDGDLRKPDVGRFLNIPSDSRGLQDVLFGRPVKKAVRSVASRGIDVLTADSRNALDAYELIASPLTAEHINVVSQNYDHVIIDTPPVLAFPDALLWAKIADAVILTSFAGQTTSMELMEAKQRLTQIDITVLGTVLNNVRVDHSYHRYGHDYYDPKHRPGKKAKRAGAKLLTPLIPI